MATKPNSPPYINEGVYISMVAGYREAISQDERPFVQYHARWLLARERGPAYAQWFQENEEAVSHPAACSTARRLRIEADLATLLALAAKP